MIKLNDFNYNLTKNEILVSPFLNVIGLRHLKEVQNQTTWEGRSIELSLGLLELIPVIGFLFTVFEVLYVREIQKNSFSLKLTPKVVYISPYKPPTRSYTPYMPLHNVQYLPLRKTLLGDFSAKIKGRVSELKNTLCDSDNLLLIGTIALVTLTVGGLVYRHINNPRPSYNCRFTSSDYEVCKNLYFEKLYDFNKAKKNDLPLVLGGLFSCFILVGQLGLRLLFRL